MTRRSNESMQSEILSALNATSEWLTVNGIAKVLGLDFNGVRKAVSILHADGRIISFDPSTKRDKRIFYAGLAMRGRPPESQNRAHEIDTLIVDILRSRAGWSDAATLRGLLPSDVDVTGEYFRKRLYALLDGGVIAGQEPIGGITYRRYAMPGTPAPAAPKDKAERPAERAPPTKPKRTTPWTVIQSVLDVHASGGTVSEIDALLANNLATQHQEVAATRDQLALLARWQRHGAAVLSVARGGGMER